MAKVPLTPSVCFPFFCEMMVIERLSHYLLFNLLGSNVVSAFTLRVIFFKIEGDQMFEKKKKKVSPNLSITLFL